MQARNELNPYYVVFQPMQQHNFQIPYPNYITHQPTLFWTYHLNTTASSFETTWPEKVAVPTEAFQTIQQPLILPQVAIKEVSKRNPRRQKNKRIRNSKKELQSAKKNSQSNIVNQLFSFFNSYEKSQNVVEKAIFQLRKNKVDLERIKSIFYNIVRLINYKRGRNYVNKENILNYYTPEGFIRHIPDIRQKFGEIQLLTLEELCFLFRKYQYGCHINIQEDQYNSQRRAFKKKKKGLCILM